MLSEPGARSLALGADTGPSVQTSCMGERSMKMVGDWVKGYGLKQIISPTRCDSNICTPAGVG